MSTINLYSTLAKAKVPFEPGDPSRVTMYVCGPTVYDYVHIGNGRPAVVFDVVFRLLREVYGADHVVYARNITDIEDKIMARAAEQGISPKTLTARYTKAYEEDTAALNCLTPTLTPKATEHLPDMIQMMRTLIDKGHAYEADGHVLFNVPSMENYGRLSGHSRDELVAGARVEVAPYKKDPADFVLWKPSGDDQVGWGSPWGRGRPGWHIECSCMIKRHLGVTIDIHAGGQDLIFPHHENEIAQSECANDAEFARYWLHNGYLTSEGVKMSKSLGNFHSVKDLRAKWHGEVLRLSLLVAHYRQPIGFSMQVLADQKSRLDRWYRQTNGVTPADTVPQTVLDAVADDLNTPKALSALDELSRAGDYAGLLAGARFLGLLQETHDAWFKAGFKVGDVDEAAILKAIDARNAAKAAKDFAKADAIRGKLLANGVLLEDGADGTKWRLK